MIDIEPTQLLPHRPPMLLVDGIQEFDEENNRIAAVTTCSTRDLLFDSELGGVAPMAAVEIMAQAIGLHSGYTDILRNIPPARMGKLLSVKQYKSYTRVLPVDVQLRVEACGILVMPPLGVFACTIHHGKQLLAEAEITVYRED